MMQIKPQFSGKRYAINETRTFRFPNTPCPEILALASCQVTQKKQTWLISLHKLSHNAACTRLFDNTLIIKLRQ